MKYIKKLRKAIFGIIALVCISLTFSFTSGNHGKYFDIIKNIEIFTNLYKEVNTNYVDEIDPGQLMRTGIDAMVGSLDPFTNYISESDIEGYRFITEGRYHGIGTKNEKFGDYITITELFKDQPADKAGLLPGDQFISVDGQSAVGRSMEEMHEIMRGYPGTTMNLVIRRPGESADLNISLIRGDVNVENVPFYGMLNDGVGYIILTTFTQNAGRNIANAFKELKDENPEMKGLILDLRNNGGGLLNEAVNICNIFIPRDEVVVSTRGKVKDRDRTFKTMNQAIDLDIPLTVLINKSSASASEIVSGVMQDYDRGVLIGQRSYGKGLVQNVMDVGYSARVKVTTSKYYIPSERCIQSVEYINGEPAQIPDERRAKFKTRNGRTVLDGGGVKPDVVLEAAYEKGIIKSLLDQHMIFDFVSEWRMSHPTIDTVTQFTFDDFSDFQQFLGERNFKFDSEAEQLIPALEKQAEEEGLDVSSEIASLKSRIDAAQANALMTYKETIIDLIEKDIAGRYYYQRGQVQMGLRNDPEIQEAIRILNAPAEYQKILSGQ